MNETGLSPGDRVKLRFAAGTQFPPFGVVLDRLEDQEDDVILVSTGDPVRPACGTIALRAHDQHRWALALRAAGEAGYWTVDGQKQCVGLERIEEFCSCGRPLHYSDARFKILVQMFVCRMGEHVRIDTAGGRAYSVPRHFLALHGVQESELPRLGFQEIGNGPGA